MWYWWRMDRSCEKWRSITQNQGVDEYPAYNKQTAKWNGHVLRTNCLLKHVIDGMMEGKTEVAGRWGTRSKQLLDDLNETGGYWKLEEEALDRTLWGGRFGRGYWSAVRRTTEWMEWITDFFFYVSPSRQQSVRRHSAAVLTGNGSDMQGIHPAMYRLWEYNQKWLFVTTGIFTEH